MRVQRYLAAAGLALATMSANAAVVTVNYTSGLHTEAWLTAGSNGASNNVVYGDGPNTLVAPQNFCANGISGATPNQCNDYNYISASQTAVFVGGGTGSVVAGNNGTYWRGPQFGTPIANYAGSLTYDNSIVISYTDMVTSATENWYKVTGGSLAWTGTAGFEVVVNPSASSGSIGGSFFGYSWTNSNVNLVTGTRGAGSRCDLGVAGSAIVGALLCGVANPASGFAYNSSGAYVNPDWSLIRDNGDGTYDLMMYSTRRTVTNSGNNLQERLRLGTSPVPVPGAIYLLGSALGLLGWARRKVSA